MKLEISQPDAASLLARERGWLEAGEEISRLSVAGEGNMNCTLRAHLHNRTLMLKQALPWVAKYPDIPAPVERLDTEAAFYKLTRHVPEVAARMPGLVGYHSAEHLLCLEDLGAGADRTDLYAMSPDNGEDVDLPSLINWLGCLHTELTVQPGDLDNMAMRQLNHAHIFEIPLTADNGVAVAEGLEDTRTALLGDSQLRERAAALGEVYLGLRAHASDPALLHGDFYPGSWLRCSDGEVRVIDFEFAFVGPAEFDHGVLLAHLTFAGIDAESRNQLLANASVPGGFSTELSNAFAGMELIRRILGVAQLPLTASADLQAEWLNQGKAAVLAWTP